MELQDVTSKSPLPVDLEKTAPRKWSQYLPALLATLSTMSVGYVDGWSSNALPILQKGLYTTGNATDNSTELHGLGEVESSWIGSLVALGAIVGSIPAGLLTEAFGRKMVLLFLSFPYLAHWALIIFAEMNVPMLYTARFISGFCMAVVCVVVPLYNEEIADVSVRGSLGVYHNLMMASGILISYIVGGNVPYIWQSALPCIIPIFFFLTFMWMPESPVHLLSRGKKEKAEKALRWLRGPHIDINPELELMQALVANKKQRKSVLKSAADLLKSISINSTNVKPLGIVLGLMAFRQLIGINAIVFYTVEIFDAAHTSLTPSMSTIIIGIIQVLATLASSFLVEKTGRRLLLLQSSIGSLICHGGVSLYFILQVNGFDLSKCAWVPVVLLSLFIVVFASGFGPIPWFMMAELIPTKDKGWAAGVIGSLNWTFMFAVTKLFEPINSELGPAWSFGCFCVTSILATIFVLTLVPETTGKTLEQIQKELRGEK